MILATLPIAILLLLLPGYAWLLLSGLIKRIGGLGSIAFSFIFSICLLSLSSAVLSLLTRNYLFYTIAGATILPIILVIVYFQRRGFGRFVHGADLSVSLLLCLGIYVAFLSGLFWSTPYYPTTPAIDSLAHAQIAQSILNGEGRSELLHANYPVGFHFVAAIVMALLGLNALQSVRLLASLVLISILVFISSSAHALFENKNLAALTTIVGALVLPVDAMHFVLIGTYPNIVGDAIVFATVCLLFLYLKEPNLPLAATLGLMGLAGVFMHSSFLLFLAALWLILPIFLLSRRKHESHLYLRACIYSTIGILAAAIVALPFLRGNMARIRDAYQISNFIGGNTTAQLFQSISVVYATLAYNIVFFVKPLNIVAVVLGFILVLLRRRRALGPVFAASWLAVIAILSLFSGETDRFVLFSMIPAIFIVGNLVGNIPLPAKVNLNPVRRKAVVTAVLIILVIFGGFLPLIPAAFNPTTRLHQQDVFASMTWLEQNRCSSSVASLGLDLDFRYIEVLTGLQYSGTLPANTTPKEALQKSASMGFGCLAMETGNPNFPSFAVDQAFQERYQNTEVAIFFIIGKAQGIGN